MMNNHSTFSQFLHSRIDCVGTLDYIFYEHSEFEQLGYLDIPTSFRMMNTMNVHNGHLLPSESWPSDHLVIGARFRLRSNYQKSEKEAFVKNTNDDENSEVNELPSSIASGLPTRPSCSPNKNCACCIGQGYSLFEMAEMRKQAKLKKQRAKRKAQLSKRINSKFGL